MPAYDFRSPRLFVAAPLAAGATLPLDRAQGHYLTTVLRLKPGAGVLVFNGRDGEWSAEIEGRKRDVALCLGAKVRDQTAPGRPALSVRAAQIGAARLHGAKGGRDGGIVVTGGTHPPRPGPASVSSACGRTPSKPPSNAASFRSPRSYRRPVDRKILATRDPARYLVFCDEDAGVANPVAALGVCRRARRSRCWSDRKAACRR